MKTIWNWLVVSSADPEKTSLTLKAAAVLTVPTILNTINLSCGIGIACFGVTSTDINSAVNAGVGVIEGVLYVFGGVAFLYGFVRKIVLTSGIIK